MAVCKRDSSHIYPPHNTTCPWCAILSTPRATTKRSAAKQVALPPPSPPATSIQRPRQQRTNQAHSPVAPSPTQASASGSRSGRGTPRGVTRFSFKDRLVHAGVQLALALGGSLVSIIVVLVLAIIIEIFSMFGPVENLGAALTTDKMFGVLLPVGWVGLCAWNLVVGLILPDEDGWMLGSIAGFTLGLVLLVVFGCMGKLDEWGALVPFIGAALGSAFSTGRILRG